MVIASKATAPEFQPPASSLLLVTCGVALAWLMADSDERWLW